MGAQVRSYFREADLACPGSPWAVRRLVRDLTSAAPPSIRRDASSSQVRSESPGDPGSACARPVRHRVRRGPGYRHRYLRRPRPGTRLDGPGHRHPRRPRFLRSGRHREGHRRPCPQPVQQARRARSQIPDAIIVAPASYNTINKWALGISDTCALGVLAETTGLDVPIVVLPFVNSRLAGCEPSAAAPKPSAPKAPASCPAPADSSPESRRVRTYREQGGVRPRPSAPGASLGLVEDPGCAADRLSGVTAAVDRLAGGALKRGGFLTAVIPDKAGG
jgi:Flavoprotein